jgi:hypothetical protein
MPPSTYVAFIKDPKSTSEVSGVRRDAILEVIDELSRRALRLACMSGEAIRELVPAGSGT